MLEIERKMIEGQLEEAKKKIFASKISLTKTKPFYGALLGMMKLIPNWSWCETMATDGQNIFFNPEFVCGLCDRRREAILERTKNNTTLSEEEKEKFIEYLGVFYRDKTPKELTFLIEHEIRHVTNSHLNRMTGFDVDLYNRAADHSANTAIVIEGSKRLMENNSKSLPWFPAGNKTIFEKDKEFGFLLYGCCDFKYSGWVTEKIYKDLLEKKQKNKDGKEKEERMAGGHVGKNGKTGDQSQTEMELMGYDKLKPMMSHEEKENIENWRKEAIESAAKVAGKACPAEIRSLIVELRRPNIDYLSFIRKRLVSRVKGDLSYVKPSRRSASMTYSLRKSGHISRRDHIVYPGRKKQEIIDVVVAFDVSGSISQETLKKIFSEIIGVCSIYDNFRVTLFCWSTFVGDVKVYTKTNFKEMFNYKVSSSGGTTATCIFEYLDANIPKCKDLIVFTDGYFEDLSPRQDWGKKYQTLWVIKDNQHFKVPFGQKVEMR